MKYTYMLPSNRLDIIDIHPKPLIRPIKYLYGLKNEYFVHFIIVQNDPCLKYIAPKCFFKYFLGLERKEPSNIYPDRNCHQLGSPKTHSLMNRSTFP